jgi:hypothetical protein
MGKLTTTRVFLSGDPTSSELEEIAGKLDMDVKELKQIMRFRDEVRASAERLNLIPPQLVAGVLNILSETILGCYEAEHRHDLITDLIEHLTSWRDETDEEVTEVTH